MTKTHNGIFAQQATEVEPTEYYGFMVVTPSVVYTTGLDKTCVPYEHVYCIIYEYYFLFLIIFFFVCRKHYIDASRDILKTRKFSNHCQFTSAIKDQRCTLER